MKVLNLYACLGGNRYKWDNCEVTAVELDHHLASMYKQRFPQDTVLVEDAHEYLKNHYQEFDFIWTSPPCPSHSRARYWRYGATGQNPTFPDMELYEEILFLQHHCKTKYVVENVIPYYEPFIDAHKRGRHLFWANFEIPAKIGRKIDFSSCKDDLAELCKIHDLDLGLIKEYKGEQRKDKILRNLVEYQAGLDIYKAAIGTYEENSDQTNFLEIIEASK